MQRNRNGSRSSSPGVSTTNPPCCSPNSAHPERVLLQAVEYRDIGVHRVDEWIESAHKGLTIEAARRIAEAATTISALGLTRPLAAWTGQTLPFGSGMGKGLGRSRHLITPRSG